MFDLFCIHPFRTEIVRSFTGGENAQSLVNLGIVDLLIDTLTVQSRIGADNAEERQAIIS